MDVNIEMTGLSEVVFSLNKNENVLFNNTYFTTNSIYNLVKTTEEVFMFDDNIKVKVDPSEKLGCKWTLPLF